METVAGTITKILFSADSGYKVLRIKTKSGSPSIITGEFGPNIVKDTVATFHGDFRKHPKYGLQFKTSSYEITYNAEELTSIGLFIDNISPNIGPERARAIVRHFGQDTIGILDNNPERLIEVEGIGEVSSESLITAWKENRKKWDEERQVYSLRSFLNSLGIKEKRVKKILAIFGGGLQAEEEIRQNPYILMKVDGFGFTTADFIAKRLGILDSNPERLKAFLIYLLRTVGDYHGHMFLYRLEIPDYINKYCLDNSTRFLDTSPIHLEDIEPSFKLLEEDKVIIVSDDCIYSKQAYDYETESARLLADVIVRKSDLIFLNKETVNEHIERFELENKLTLSPEQRDALHFFAEYKVFVITGAPGTGKTTVLKAVVELARKMHLNLTCMTPTGISAKKLATTVDHDAYTIHRRLGFRGNQWIYNDLNQFDTDVAIIDECSMVDQEVFYRLMSALKRRTHFIFVGDHHQLPSVGAGNVLKELINSDQIPVVRLEKIFRQDEASDIIKVAHRIKNGDVDLGFFSPDPQSDVFFMRKHDPDEIEKIIIALAQKFKDERRLFQIITPRKDGPLGVAPLNETLQKILNPPSPVLPEVKILTTIIRKGDRIIVRKNDYEKDIFNGDIGKVIDVSGGLILIDIDDKIIALSLEEAGEKLSLAYAITCHRAQGLEYPYVILPFINQFGKMLLQRNLIYTAITRAKEKVIVLGHGSAIERAINNSSVAQRNTRFGERIRECLSRRKKNSTQQWHGEPQTFPPANKSTEPSSLETQPFFTGTTEP